MRKGVPVSPGVAVGTAYCVHQIYVDPAKRELSEHEVPGELLRFDEAVNRVAQDLQASRHKVESQLGSEAAAIFSVHEAILRDPAFCQRLRRWISEERLPPQLALERLIAEYTQIFSRTDDEYLRERLADVRDVALRLSSYLSDVLRPEKRPGLGGPLIVVADELLPSQAVMLGKIDVKAIVTQSGSQTSHAAILARSRGIPAVSGVRGILQEISTGDCLVVDGSQGHVLVNPDTETAAAYRKLEREYVDLRDHLAANREQPAVTADGTPLELLANVNNLLDAHAARAMGATGVGLFRTEYLYLTHPAVPSEDEQCQVYREMVEASPNHLLTIRTLDIGGDKTIPFLGHRHSEANPFLGWRSIRLSFEHPEFFAAQLRAILRAAYYAQEMSGQIRMLLPMISTVEELRHVRRMVRRIADELKRRGTPYASVPIGAMLEVPAAAVCIHSLLDVADFVSIGSNDLVQYLMAADRDNPKVSHLYQPLGPPVLQVLASVIGACNARGKPVTLCGEMAGQPRAFIVLLGMGLRQFSMSPAFLPLIKQLARSVTIAEAEAVWHSAAQLKTTRCMKRYLTRQLERLAPDLSRMETA